MMRPIDVLYVELEIIEKKLKEQDSIKRSAIINDQIENRKFNIGSQDEFLAKYKENRDRLLQTQQTFVMVANKKNEIDEAIQKEKELVKDAIRHEKEHPVTKQQENAERMEVAKKVDKGGKYLIIGFIIIVIVIGVWAYFTGQF